MSPNPPNSSKDLVRKYKERCRLEGQHRNDWDWTTGELQNCLGNTIREVAENVQIILFVDALDELGKDVALEVIDYFQDLLVNVDQNFKICFSCRHYPNLSTYDEDSICLEDENDGDIRTCIHSKLRRYQESLKLENKIAEMANGVFQWAVLVTAHVIDLETSGYSYHFLEQNLQHMPQKLHELYSHLLKNPSDETVRLLQWVYFSCEPLTWGAIRHAMAVDPGAPRRSIITYEMESGWGNSESEAAKLFNTLSRGLVQIAIAAQPHNTGSEEKVKTVHFIHQSVSDFLFSKGLEEIHVALSDQAAGSAQVYLCKTCLAYLGTPEIQDHAESSWQEGENILDRFPLLQYSARYWPKHAKLASDLGTDQQYLVDSFSYPRSTLGGAYEKTAKYFDDDWNSYDTTISVCAGIQKHFGVDKDKSYEGTIIHVLARYGLFTALKILISHGDAFLGVLDRRHETPLHTAVRNGSVEIVDYLLSEGLSPNAKNEAHATPLHIAAEFGYLQIAILLLRVGAERDPNNCLNSEPDMNLEPGAVISGHFEPYKGPLTYAIENHHWQVAELLLDLTGLSEAGQSSNFVDQSSSDSPERHFVEKMWSVLGRLHPLSILALWHSTGALRSREKLGEARSMDQAFIESFDTLSERESQRQAWNVMEEFASIYVSRQQFKYAEEVYTQLRMSRETCLGMDDPETLKSTFEFIEKVRWGKFNPPDVEEYESTPQEGPQPRIPTHPWGARLFRGRSSL
ncbi:hypothetical protein SLS56_008730 [Neofusicoccum ribis]|uniref:Ankyrin repeat protein n=1 Tax=Neofusicoccum ribis TaxID=45134 RepID=A0ABR3SK48_9PEZI